MTLKCQALRAKHVFTLWITFISVRKQLAKMTFTNGAFVFVSTIEYRRKETENVAQSNENGTRYRSEQKVEHLSKFELSALRFELIK